MTQENKNIVARLFKEFWGNPWNPRIINELATADILLHYPMHEPKKGRASVTKFMMDFREAFPDLNFKASAISSPKATTSWDDGRAAVLTRAQPSAIFASAQSRRLQDGR
jgi:SnoaL-like polyketide cyclase